LAAVSSNHKPAIIPRDLFQTNHKTVQSSGGGQLFFDALLGHAQGFQLSGKVHTTNLYIRSDADLSFYAVGMHYLTMKVA
jgi:hypothetical protein